jgi:hypothetical protein
MHGGNIKPDNSELLDHCWKPGPHVWPLQRILALQNTIRGRFEKVCGHHMGLGAGVHISSVAEPIEYLMKRYGVIEQNFEGALSIEFIDAAKRQSVTAEMISNLMMLPWCAARNPSVHISQLQTAEANRIAWMSIPWIVRYNPSRYPFMMPAAELAINASNSELRTKVITSQQNVDRNVFGKARECGRPDWQLKCIQPGATTY